MEYKTDKRTKNLTLRDIHVGDWVQEWSPIPEKYSPPMKVSCINYDGTVYLVPDDEHYCDPVETEIENVDALEIDADLLRGFGFKKSGDFYLYENSVFAVDKQLDFMDFFYIDPYGGDTIQLDYVDYMHELQQALSEERNFIGNFNIEWKGIER